MSGSELFNSSTYWRMTRRAELVMIHSMGAARRNSGMLDGVQYRKKPTFLQKFVRKAIGRD